MPTKWKPFIPVRFVKSEHGEFRWYWLHIFFFLFPCSLSNTYFYFARNHDLLLIHIACMRSPFPGTDFLLLFFSPRPKIHKKYITWFRQPFQCKAHRTYKKWKQINVEAIFPLRKISLAPNEVLVVENHSQICWPLSNPSPPNSVNKKQITGTVEIVNMKKNPQITACWPRCAMRIKNSPLSHCKKKWDTKMCWSFEGRAGARRNELFEFHSKQNARMYLAEH